jgi:hypothetical protein
MRGVTWGRCTGTGLIAVGLVAAPASAEVGKAVDGKAEQAVAADAASGLPGRFDFKPPRHDLQLGVGTGILVGLSRISENRGDMADTGLLPAGVGPSVAVRHQWPSAWSAGLRGVWLFTGDRFSVTSGDAFWQLAAEGRWQPEGELGPYAELGAGTMVAINRYGAASSWQWAPLVEGAIGFDVGVVGPIALGFELRGALTFFSAEGESFEVDDELISQAYGTTPWLGLSVSVSLGI